MSEALWSNVSKSPILATITYCAASISMMFANKYVLSIFQFNYQLALISWQCTTALIVVLLLRLLGIIQVEKLRLSTAQTWVPVTVLFLGMIYTGSKSLSLLSIPVVTVFKNLTNIFIAYGDKYLYGQYLSNGVLASLICMVVGSVLTSKTDEEYNTEGYIWILLNCFCTASYTLYLRKIKTVTKLSEFGMATYNNLLSVLCLFPIGLISGEFKSAYHYEHIQTPSFFLAITFTGVIGTLLGLASFWLVNVTSPTTYSIIGSLNKVPLVVISISLFNTPMTIANFTSVMFGITSGIMFTAAKYSESKKTVRKTAQPV